MQTFEVLEKAIPRGAAERVAQALHVTADYVRRWRREPTSDEAPLASGQRSPLDRVCDLIDAIFLANPQGACLIVEHVRAHYNALMETHAGAGFNGCAHERAVATATLLRETTEAVNALGVEGVTNHTLTELVEMRDATENVIARVQADIRHDRRKDESIQ